MTYKYMYVRREMYENDPAGKLKSFRSIAEMAHLFKLPYWIMLGILFVSIISLAVYEIVNSKSPFIWIPILTTIIVFTRVVMWFQRQLEY